MEIPAYAAGRLDEPARGRLEAHLRECDSCKEMVTTFQELVRELREEGATLFETHPDALVLRTVARGEEPPDAAGIRRHLESCPTCHLEVRAWQGVLTK